MSKAKWHLWHFQLRCTSSLCRWHSDAIRMSNPVNNVPQSPMSFLQSTRWTLGLDCISSQIPEVLLLRLPGGVIFLAYSEHLTVCPPPEAVWEAQPRYVSASDPQRVWDEHFRDTVWFIQSLSLAVGCLVAAATQALEAVLADRQGFWGLQSLCWRNIRWLPRQLRRETTWKLSEDATLIFVV